MTREVGELPQDFGAHMFRFAAEFDVLEHPEGPRLGDLRLRLGDPLLFEHGVDDVVAPIQDLLGAATGVVESRVADQYGESGGLIQGELGHLAVEELTGGSLDTVRAGSEVHGVHVELEDLVLRKAPFEFGGDKGFLHLPLDRDFVTDEDVFHHLLGDGRTTPGVAAPKVVETRPKRWPGTRRPDGRRSPLSSAARIAC